MSLTNTIRVGTKTLRPWFNTKTANTLDFNINRANGCYIYDKNDTPIMDFTSGLMVTNLGHNNSIINARMKQEIDNGLLYFPPSVLSEERETLSDNLIKLSPHPDGKVFYTNGGADANESAVYFAKRHFKELPKKNRILRFDKSFHGGSSYISSYLGGDSRRNEKQSHYKFELNTDIMLPNPSLRDNGKRSIEMIERIIQNQHNSIAAIMIEGSSGTAGCYVYPYGYYNKLEKMARDHNILVIVDEVMSGFGRTGKMFAYEHYNGTPDIITMAKGLTNGCVPMGAAIISSKLAKDYEETPVNNGLTYSGHPLACVAANVCLHLYTDELLEQVRKNGDTIRGYLNYMALNYPQLIKEYRGMGQLYCIEFYDDNVAYIQKALMDKNVYTFFRDNNLYIAPPLIISDAELVHTLEKLDSVCMFANSHM
jgi:taurine--2-oxoglutarate transaminase